MPLYQSRQADMSVTGCHRRDGGKGEREDGRQLCRAEVMGGEGAACLHFARNEERAEGCVKGKRVFFCFCLRCLLAGA